MDGATPAVSATKAPTPTAVPTWRLMLITAVPVVARSVGKVLAAANIGANDSPADTPMMSSPGSISVQ
jgi:hypothetical protein